MRVHKKGFDNFFPKDRKNKEEGNDKDEKSTEKDSNNEEGGSEDGGSNPEKKKKDSTDGSSTDDSTKHWTSGGFGPFRSNHNYYGNNGSGGGGGGGGGGPNFGQTMATAGLLLFLTYLLMRTDQDGSSSSSSSSSSDAFTSREITWGDFCNHLLETGQVEKIVVTNNRNMAKVYLKPGATGLPHYQQSRHVRYSERRQLHQKQQQQRSGSRGGAGTGGDSSGDGMMDDPFNSSASSESSSLSGLGGSAAGGGVGLGGVGRHQPHQIVYRLAVGSVDAFEKKLEEAQRAVNMDPSKEIPVQYTAESSIASEIFSVVPSLLVMGAVFFFMRYATGSMMGGGGSGGGRGGMGGIFQIGKSTHKKINKEDVKIDFSNVAGCEEAKKEVMEFVDFLQDPTQFTKLGAKIPKGALLCGPPGTGKTLLAKAVAGEAGVPFYTISGSDFIGRYSIY